MNERQKYKWKQDLSWLKNRIKFKINRIFFMTQDKMVMFESYHGKRCGDSVRAIYEEMLKDDTFRDYTFVWAFSKPSETSGNFFISSTVIFLNIYIISF